MSVTGKLGTAQSMLGNFQLGITGSTSNIQAASNTLTLTQSLLISRPVHVGNTLTITQQALPSGVPPIITSLLGISKSKFGKVVFGKTVATATQVAFSTLTLSQSVAAGIPIHVSASNVLTFGQNLFYAGPKPETAANTITFAQSARAFNGTKQVSQSLVLTQTVADAKVYERSVSNTLSFITVADVVRLNLAHSTITFSNSATADKFTGAYSTLTITQVADRQYTHSDSASSALVLTQTVEADPVFVRSASNALTFQESVDVLRVRFFSVAQTFVITQDASNARIVRPNNALDISQDVSEFRILHRNVGNILNLTQTLNRQAIYGRSVGNTLAFQTYYLKPTEIGQTGVGDYAVKVPIPQVMVTKVVSSVVFQVQNRALVLKRPLLGDGENGLGKLILQRTITGGYYTYARKTHRRKLKYSFLLDRNKALETRRFFLDYLSTPITLTNFKGEIWVGYASQPDFDLVAKARGGPGGDQFTFEVEFEGTRIH